MISKGNRFKKKIDSATRIQLIRRGNQFFNEGKIESAEKIFITVDYKDGLVRLGDYYLKQQNIYKSCEMYFMSENVSKINTFCKKIALAIEKLLEEDSKTYNKILSRSKKGRDDAKNRKQ